MLRTFYLQKGNLSECWGCELKGKKIVESKYNADFKLKNSVLDERKKMKGFNNSESD